MKNRINLLVACLAIVGIAGPIDAEITKNTENTSPSTASTRAKDLESLLRESGLCKQYPVVVRIVNNKVALVATCGDRQLSDQETKLLALKIAQLISSSANQVVEAKVRIYDPASSRFWKDITLNTAQIQDGLKSAPEQEQTLNSIKLVNNFGLVDGPNLDARVDLYTHILKLRRDGIDVQSFLSELTEIEAAEKRRRILILNCPS